MLLLLEKLIFPKKFPKYGTRIGVEELNMKWETYLKELEERSLDQISRLQRLAKHLFDRLRWEPADLQNKCLEAWDRMKEEMNSKILPFVPVKEKGSGGNLIFGSGTFSTGEFQIKQYLEMLCSHPPIKIQAIISNKSLAHGCKASEISKNANIPLIELDFEN